MQPSTCDTATRIFALWLRAVLPCVLALAVSVTPSLAADSAPGALLTNAQQVFNLGVEGARREPHPVRLTVVVTCPVLNRPWFYAQDKTAGILVLYPDNLAQPPAGQLVEVEGTTFPGLSAAHVSAESFRVVGVAPLPEPHRTDASRLTAGEDFGHWVSVEGRVVDLFLHPAQLSLLLAAGDYHFVVNVRVQESMRMPMDWLGARIEARGVCWTEALSPTQPIGFRLHTPGTNTITILKPGHANPFANPLRTAISLRERRGGADERIRVSGTVTVLEPGRFIFLQDDTGAVKARLLIPISKKPFIDSVHADTLLSQQVQATLSWTNLLRDRSFIHPLPRVGDRIEVVGTPSAGLGALLADAEYRRIGVGTPITPVASSFSELFSGIHEDELVKVRGRLVDRESHQVGSSVEDLLVLRDGDKTLQASYTSDRNEALPPLPPNALLEVTGVCTSEAGEWKTIRTLRLLLRGTSDIRVLGQPPAWESWRVGRILGIAGALGVVALAWISFLRRRVAIRTAELARSNELLQAEVEERKRAQSNLARALDAEKELSQLKSRFVSMVSHEFRTPLGVILSSADLLSDYRETLSPEESAEQIADIKQATRHMASLMEDVLVLGRDETGTMQCRPFPIDLPGFCLRLVDEILSATNRACPIQVQQDNLSGAARGDETLLRHVILNLLSNAVKYSAAGQPVEFRIAREGDDAIFTVVDKGIGMPADDQKHIFDAFFRGKNVGERPGSGLGLVIVKRCVDLQGGSIHFQSAEGRGTSVTVRLPLFQPPGNTETFTRDPAELQNAEV